MLHHRFSHVCKSSRILCIYQCLPWCYHNEKQLLLLLQWTRYRGSDKSNTHKLMPFSKMRTKTRNASASQSLFLVHRLTLSPFFRVYARPYADMQCTQIFMSVSPMSFPSMLFCSLIFYGFFIAIAETLAVSQLLIYILAQMERSSSSFLSLLYSKCFSISSSEFVIDFYAVCLPFFDLFVRNSCKCHWYSDCCWLYWLA